MATHHTIPFNTEKATLVVNDSIVTTHTAEYVTHAKTAPPMIQYIKEKKGWSQQTYDKVDRAALGLYMRKVSVSTRAKVVKLQYNWQNTGRQKGLFLQSAGTTQEAITEASRCLMGCGEYESPLHYLTCCKNPKGAEMARNIKDIKKSVEEKTKVIRLSSANVLLWYHRREN